MGHSVLWLTVGHQVSQLENELELDKYEAEQSGLWFGQRTWMFLFDSPSHFLTCKYMNPQPNPDTLIWSATFKGNSASTIRSLVLGFHLFSSSSCSLLFIALSFCTSSSHFSRDKHMSEQGEAGTNQSIDLSTYPLKCPSDRQQKTKCLSSETLSPPPHHSASLSLHLLMEKLSTQLRFLFQLQCLRLVTPVWAPYFCSSSPSFLSCLTYFANLNSVTVYYHRNAFFFKENDTLWKYWNYKKMSVY